MKMKIVSLFICSLFISGCQLFKPASVKGYYGKFGEPEKQVIASQNALAELKSQSLDQVSDSLPWDSAQISGDTSVRAFFVYRRNGKLLYIDTIPPKQFQNDADKRLLKAATRLKTSEFLRKNPWILPLALLAVLAAIIAAIAAAAETNFDLLGNATNLGELLLLLFIYMILMIVLLVVAIALIVLWLFLFFFSFMIPSMYRNNVVKLILGSAKAAPDDRRIEYEVRALKMVKGYVSQEQFEKSVLRVRQIVPKYSLYPGQAKWLNELDKIETEIQEKKKIATISDSLAQNSKDNTAFEKRKNRKILAFVGLFSVLSMLGIIYGRK